MDLRLQVSIFCLAGAQYNFFLFKFVSIICCRISCWLNSLMKVLYILIKVPDAITGLCWYEVKVFEVNTQLLKTCVCLSLQHFLLVQIGFQLIFQSFLRKLLAKVIIVFSMCCMALIMSQFCSSSPSFCTEAICKVFEFGYCRFLIIVRFMLNSALS